MKIDIILTAIASALILSACVTQPTGPGYPHPESYLSGKNIEQVVEVYGNPETINTVGQTILISYSGIGKAGKGFLNICFLELQADNATKIIKNVKIGSNLGIDQKSDSIDVRQDCNRVLYRYQLAN